MCAFEGGRAENVEPEQFVPYHVRINLLLIFPSGRGFQLNFKHKETRRGECGVVLDECVCVVLCVCVEWTEVK